FHEILGINFAFLNSLGFMSYNPGNICQINKISLKIM
ncbi:unnamed protein product, partial [marine sediment metagenome]